MPRLHRTKHRENNRVVAAQLRRSFGHRPSFGLAPNNVLDKIVNRALTVAPTRKRQRKRVIRIDRECLFEQIERLGAFPFLQRPHMGHRTHSIVVSAQILWTLAPGAFNLGDADRRLYRASQLLRDPVLKIENIVHRAVVPRTPDVSATFGLDELHGDAEAVTALLHAALDQIGDPQFPADVARIRRAAFVGEGRVSSDDEEGADA